MLGKYLRMFNDKVDVNYSGAVGLKIEIDYGDDGDGEDRI